MPVRGFVYGQGDLGMTGRRGRVPTVRPGHTLKFVNRDAKRNIFATAVNGVYVFAPDFTLIGRIVTNDKTANCAWGDDGTVLYMATNDKLTRIKTTTKGLGW